MASRPKLKSINLAYDRLRGVGSRSAEKQQQDLFAYDFGNGWGFVDRQGKLMIRPRFQTAGQFSEGVAHVSACGRHGFINWQGDT